MVYVDGMNAAYGRMKMCHMIADSTEELLSMADAIGVQRKWIQNAGTHREHFDVCGTKKMAALKLGAVEVTQRELALKLRLRRPVKPEDFKLTPPFNKHYSPKTDNRRRRANQRHLDACTLAHKTGAAYTWLWNDGGITHVVGSVIEEGS